MSTFPTQTTTSLMDVDSLDLTIRFEGSGGALDVPHYSILAGSALIVSDSVTPISDAAALFAAAITATTIKGTERVTVTSPSGAGVVFSGPASAFATSTEATIRV